MWVTNHHSVPLAQYGHYWSSVGGLLSEDQTSDTETDGGEPYLNGNGLKHQQRKVSNIPMGVVNQDEEEDNAQMIPPLALKTNQNGHPFNVGTMGIRDVRIKKTMFQNLSPYRK